MAYVIHKEASFCTLKDGNPIPIAEALRAVDASRMLNPGYKLGTEPAYVNFFNAQTRKFPTGLLALAITSIKVFNKDADIQIVDKVVGHVKLDLVLADVLHGITLHPWQLEAVNKILKAERGVIHAGTGSGKTIMMMAIIAELRSKGLKVMVVVPTTPILAKTVSQMEECLDVKVGMYGGQRKDIEDITVITNQSLSAYARSRNFKTDTPFGTGKAEFRKDTTLTNFIEEADAIFIDEVHLSTAPAWYSACMMSKAWFRVGLTGTIDSESEIRVMRLQAATGEILVEKKAHELIEEGLLAKPFIHAIVDEDIYGHYKTPPFPLVDDPIRYTRLLYEAAVVNNRRYNSYVVDLIEAMANRGWAILVVCQRKAHFRLLSDLMQEIDIEFFACCGDTPLGARVEAMDTVEREGQGIILATKIFDLGIDIPALDAVVLTAGGKAPSTIKQRIGRGLRAKKGKENVVHIFDFMDNSHRKLAQHAVFRWEVYEDEKFEIVPEDNFVQLVADVQNKTL